MRLTVSKIPVFPSLGKQTYTIDTLSYIISFFNIFLIDFNKKTAIFRKHCQVVKSYKNVFFVNWYLVFWKRDVIIKISIKKITGGSEK